MNRPGLPGALLHESNLDDRTLKAFMVQRLELVDFPVLIPSCTDAHRNEVAYLASGNTSVEKLLGDLGWRAKREADRPVLYGDPAVGQASLGGESTR